MPWLDDSHVDPAWIRQATGIGNCQSCSAEDISNTMRRGQRIRDGATLRLTLELLLVSSNDDPNATTTTAPSPAAETDAKAPVTTTATTTRTMTLIVKQVATEAGRQLSQQLGLAREALFYRHLAPQIVQQAISKTNDDNDDNDDDHVVVDDDHDHDDDLAILPKIYYAHGNYQDGSKLILMQDLGVVVGSNNNHKSSKFMDSGVLFGPGNPNNWTRNVEQMAKEAGNPPPSLVARVTFEAMAKVHALYWKQSKLLLLRSSSDQNDFSWLRGHDWIQGQNQISWEATQQLLRTSWNAYLTREQQIHDDDGRDDGHGHAPQLIAWDPTVRAAVEKAMDGISWQAQIQRLNTQTHWTLVHGDFWPGNVLWKVPQHNTATMTTTTTNDSDSVGNTRSSWLRLVDWEMVGLGSGPQELGQYVISNMSRSVRQECEESLVRHYYSVLTTTYRQLHAANLNDNDNNDNKTLPDMGLSWEECWKEYTVGGLERWLWFLIFFAGKPDMISWVRFFHNQIADFMADHQLTAQHVTQPRP
ncbi:hypothetical protein ACA910_008276 [Epithemia clementina (nom. ined.)]